MTSNLLTQDSTATFRHRYEVDSAIEVKQFGTDGKCRIVAVATVDSKGLPSAALVRLAKLSARTVYDAQLYFLSQRTLADLDADDGRSMGSILCTKTREEVHTVKGETYVRAPTHRAPHRLIDSLPVRSRRYVDVRLRKLFSELKGLEEANKEHEALQPMLRSVLLNRLRVPADLERSLCNLRARGGATIGGGLAAALATNLTALAAVDEWILRYPAVGELDES